MLSCEEIVERLKGAKLSLSRRYGVSDIAVFGAYSRGEAEEDSEIDLLVTFKHPIGIRLIDLEDELETLLSRRVDIVTRKGIQSKYLKDIRKELVPV